jgi:hypothetical protein
MDRQNCSRPPPMKELTHGGSRGWGLPLSVSLTDSLEWRYEISFVARSVCTVPR